MANDFGIQFRKSRSAQAPAPLEKAAGASNTAVLAGALAAGLAVFGLAAPGALGIDPVAEMRRLPLVSRTIAALPALPAVPFLGERRRIEAGAVVLAPERPASAP